VNYNRHHNNSNNQARSNLLEQGKSGELTLDDGREDGQFEATADRAHPDDGSKAMPVSDRGPYPRLESGIYEAECVKADTYRDRQFGRWSCALEFQLLADGTHVFCFLNLGRGAKAHAGPRSEYRRTWVIAVGTQPRRRQVLSDRVFVGKIFDVRVGDVNTRFDGRNHPEGAIYSVVREIVRRTFP
jgi:hypothetical protein